MAHGFVRAVQKRMEGNISEKYRDALLYKKEVYVTHPSFIRTVREMLVSTTPNASSQA